MPLSTDGYFLYELTGVADGQAATPELVGYDAAGHVIKRLSPGAGVRAAMARGHLEIDIQGMKPLLEIQTRRTKQPIRLYVVERDGRRCTVLVTPGARSSGCAGEAGELKPGAINVAPNQIGAAPDGMLLLWGQVGRAIDRLELRFEDGRLEQLPLADHFALYQVDPGDFAAGRRPLQLVGRNADGEIEGVRKLGPWGK